MKLNDKGETMIQHHVKYKELHGVDEVIGMTVSEHRKLHAKLRSENKCNVPVDVLAKISQAAHQRSDDRHNKRAEYEQNNRDKINDLKKIYRCENIRTHHFTESMGNNIQFYEQVGYNQKTRDVFYNSRFRATNGYTLPIIYIK